MNTQVLDIVKSIVSGLFMIVGAGGCITLVGLILKYLLDNRKLGGTEAKRLEARIVALELSRDDCLERERELSERVGHLQGMMDSSTLIIANVVCDDKGIITEWSHTASALFHWSSDEAIGQPITMLVPLELRPQHEQAFDKAMKKGETKEVNLRSIALTRDGTRIKVHIALRVWNREGHKLAAAEIRRR